MGEQDSYRETFALRVGNTQLTKVGGRGQVKMQYTMGEVNMSASLQDRAARQLNTSTQQRSQLIGLASVSDSVAPVGMQI